MSTRPNHTTATPESGRASPAAPRAAARALLIAYLLPVVVAALVAADTIASWRSAMPRFGDKLVLVVVSAYFLVSVLALLVTRNREYFLRRVAGPLLVLYSVAFSLALAECALRVIEGPWRRTAVYTPNKVWTFHDQDATLRFSTNALGLRGPALPAGPDVFRIITIGGSTTASVDLDDATEWPQQLTDELNRRQHDWHVWAGNAGVNGHTTAHHLQLLRSFPVLGRSNVLLFLVGINDLQASLTLNGGSTTAYLQASAAEFVQSPARPYFRRLVLLRILRDAFMAHFGDFVLGVGGHAEQRRTLGPRVPLPDLTLGLREYQTRLADIADECHRRALRCVFLTQPSLYRRDLTAEERQTLWMGWVGPLNRPLGFVSAADMETALAAYNQTLLALCHTRGLECYDLASAVPRNRQMMFGDVHFTTVGASAVAAFIAAHLQPLPAPPQRPSSP